MRRATPYPCSGPSVSSVLRIISASVPCQTSAFALLIWEPNISRVLWECNRKAVEREQRDVVARAAVERQVREDLTDDAAELEAVTREAGRNGDARRVRQPIDHEVLVARVREQTRFHRERWAVRVRKKAPDAVAQHGFVRGVTAPVHGVRIDAFAAVMVFPDLEPRLVVAR